MKEEIEIAPGDNGVFVARLSWGNVIIEKPLPPGFETWSDDEQRAHFKRFVVPRLKALIARARAGKPLAAQDGEVIVQDETGRGRLEAAEEKRARKARKLERAWRGTVH